jgi:Pyruvate/2-oxoacid:ferredoxin oxidoreductase delta subunit
MILFCACAYSDVIPKARKAATLRRLRAEHPDVRIIPDLCKLAARRDPLLDEAIQAPELVVAACHTRAVRALFEWTGLTLDPERTTFINMRDFSAAELRPSPEEDFSVDTEPSDWIPWFPVIDDSRCVSCKQCLDFCLFGVYESTNGAVKVVNPESCKTNCPACARICPEAAIIFPKYIEGPISGAEIIDEEAVRAAAKKVAEGDLRIALEERSKRRRELLKPEFRVKDGDAAK